MEKLVASVPLTYLDQAVKEFVEARCEVAHFGEGVPMWTAFNDSRLSHLNRNQFISSMTKLGFKLLRDGSRELGFGFYGVRLKDG